MLIEDLQSLSKEKISIMQSINIDSLAKEVVSWLCENVANYVDNHEFEYSLTFGNVSNYPSLYKIECAIMDFILKSDQSNSIADELRTDIEVQIFETLNKLMKETTEKLKDHSVTNEVFEKLKYFYEVVGFNYGKPVVKQLEGYIDFKGIDFDSTSMDVVIKKRNPNESTENEEEDEEVINVGSSFLVDFSISLWEKKIETSLF